MWDSQPSCGDRRVRIDARYLYAGALRVLLCWLGRQGSNQRQAVRWQGSIIG